MLLEHIDSAARIPVVKMVSGCKFRPETRKYAVVAYATVDERDREHISRFRWTLRKTKTSVLYATRNNCKNDPRDRSHTLHREVWELHNGPVPKGLTIDHENRDGLDNRLGNLRLATPSQQGCNKVSSTNSSVKYKGVTWSKKGNAQGTPYQASIRRDGTLYFLCYYSIAEEAAHAYNAGARLLHGEFARLNIIPAGSVSPERIAEITTIVESKLAAYADA